MSTAGDGGWRVTSEAGSRTQEGCLDRPGRRIPVLDVLLVAAGCISLLAILWNPASSRWRPSQPTNPAVTRIAAVYMAARLYRAESGLFPERFAAGAADPLAQYLPARGGAVPDDIIPDLTAYDVDATFLEGSDAPGTIVVVAEAPKDGARTRLVVLQDGSLKAVEAAGAVLGKTVADSGGRVHDITPEGGVADR